MMVGTFLFFVNLIIWWLLFTSPIWLIAMWNDSRRRPRYDEDDIEHIYHVYYLKNGQREMRVIK